MVGLVRSPTGGEEYSEPKTQRDPEQVEASDPLAEQLLLDLEENSISFADSFLDFDYLNYWIEQGSDLHSMESAVNVDGVFGCDGACEQVEHSEQKEMIGSMSYLEAEKVHDSEEVKVKEEIVVNSGDETVGELGGVTEDLNDQKLDSRSMKSVVNVDGEEVEYSGEKEKIGSLRYLEAEKIDCGEEVKVKEEVVVNCGDEKVRQLGCVIEKEMGKVNLNGTYSVKEGVEAMNREEVAGITEDMYSHGVKNNDNDHDERAITMNTGDKKGAMINGSSDSDSGCERDSLSSSSSSASSSDDDDEKGVNIINRRASEIEEGEILACISDDMVAWSDDDDGVEGSGPKGPIRSKNELQELPFVPPVNVTIQPHHQTLPVGNISSILGAQVIVEGVEKHSPLNEGSILWITETRSPLGIVDEIFGPVKNPYYIVRYNSEDEVPAGIQQGTVVSFVQEFAHHVLNDKSIYKKGYDASGENDEELSEEGEFSDDEKEAEYKRMMKMKKRGTNEHKYGGNKMEKKKVRNPPVYQKQNQVIDGENVSSGSIGVPVDQTKTQGSSNGHWSNPASTQSAQFHGFGGASSSGGGLPYQQQQPQNNGFQSLAMPPQQKQPQNNGFQSFAMPLQQQQQPQNHGFQSFAMPPHQQQQPQNNGFQSFAMPPQQQQQQPQNNWFRSFAMPPQQQHQMMPFPGGLPAMNMQWAQPFFNMPMGNNIPMNNVGPMFPTNFMLPGGQPSFGIFNQPPPLGGQGLPIMNPSQQQVLLTNNATPQSESGNDSWPQTPGGQPSFGIFNQPPPLGGQGLPMMNPSQQVLLPNNATPQSEPGKDSSPQPSATPERPRNSDQPGSFRRSFRGGRQTNHRGGGRFRGGRGRRQNNN
ncbi:unnamed protein product [Cuscuta europaea]|uniref:H/ACA ribonucleoprotein complex non-core subunit NAF1 n=2 Tax=Cuscuta europaea TaxID=41803 RepID=A0A9P1EM74_CUSEU|nr:unnamed protein product [Cuscuta europaea]